MAAATIAQNVRTGIAEIPERRATQNLPVLSGIRADKRASVRAYALDCVGKSG
jgi:hypothetical protein